MSQKENYKLLSNLPCGEDRFEGKSHERIALHIADIIRYDTDIRIIGIEGGWGSGKSNLVRLIENNLSERSNGKNYKFFNYDAWGHITDFQRRSILEELTEFLIGDLSPRKTWEDKKTKLLSKSKTTHTETLPHLNGFLAMFIIILLITPLLSALISTLPTWWHTSGWATWLLAIIYFFLVCIGILWRNDQKRFEEDDNDTKRSSKFEFDFSDLFSVYTKKANSTTTYEQLHEDEPSSREFKEWISEINESLPRNEVVILVFDNMDRLPNKKVQEFWAAVHTFFSSDQDRPLKKIKVIIPFDRKHVNSAFSKANEGEDETYGDDFINKTFDVVYSVPPIIMTQWKAYFSEAWKQAFRVASPVEVTQIFDAFNINKTPREIIAFINQCVTIKQTNDDIDDKYIALFIFGKKDIEKDPVKGILNPDFIKPLDFIYRNDKELPVNMSALFYQLPKDKAVDIVLSSKIVRELDNNAPDSLEVNEKNEDFLIRLLEKAIPQVTNIENSVLAFNSLELKDSNKKEALWHCLCDIALAKDTQTGYSPYKLLVFKHSKERYQYFDTFVRSCIDIIKYFSGEGYKKAIDAFSDIDHDLVRSYFTSNRYEIEGDKYLEILKACGKDINNYGVKCELSKIDEHLGKVDIDGLRKVRGIKYVINSGIEIDKQLPLYLSKLKKLLDANRNLPGNLLTIYCHYKELYRPISEDLWLKDDELYNLKNAIDKDNLFIWDVVAMRIARLDKFNSSYRSAFNDVLQSTEEDDVKGLSSCIEYYIDYGDLLLNISKINCPLVKAVVNELTVHSYGVQQMNLTEVLDNYDQIIAETGIGHELIFEQLNGWQIHYTPLSDKNISLTLLKDAIDQDNELASKIRKNVSEIYNSVSQEDWKKSILANDHLINMLLVYHPHNIQYCFDAFKSILKDYASDGHNKIKKDYSEILLKLFVSLNNDVEYLFNEIYDILKAAHSKERILYFGEWLLRYCSQDRKKSFLSDLVPTDIIDEEVAEFILRNPASLDSKQPQGFVEKLSQLSKNEMKDNAELKEVVERLTPKERKKKED